MKSLCHFALSIVLSWLACACSGGTSSESKGFVSADASRGDRAFPSLKDGAPSETNGEPQRTIEEGDIYRLLDTQTLINLNTYRGLQLIDLSDLTNPHVVGRLAIAGTPVEMYVVGTRAIVLLNGWSGYYGARNDVRVERASGGVVLSVDLSNPAAPVVLDREVVPGSIRTSRLARGGDSAALYVAATRYDELSDGTTVSATPHTYVESFDASSPDLMQATELELGGSVSDIQATSDAMLVARADVTSTNQGSSVSLIDISSPTGEMVEGDQITVSGRVASQFNLDLYKGVLRVVSGDSSSGERINHLETFDAADFAHVKPLDHCTFGAGQDLYATLFVDNRAFFVTYLRVDPFHAFEIGDDGKCTERSEFKVSGWNDFFRSTLGDTRLIGVGIDDQDGRRSAAVSLYDITDLTSSAPLLGRASVGTDSSWSDASWDHKAFSVIEDAVSVKAPDGTPEHGLVLLPFSGFRESGGDYEAAVQLFTFSASTLTRRGTMDHGSPVRRSFLLDSGSAANLSDSELSTYDVAAPDAPQRLGTVALAPSYTRVFRFGDHVVRLEDSSWSYGWWGTRVAPPASKLQVLAAGADPDLPEALATLDVPQGAQLYRVGSLLVSVSSAPKDTSSWPFTWATNLRVFDLKDPTHPKKVGELDTDRLRPFYAAWGYRAPAPAADCLGCIGGYYFPGRYDDLVRVVGDALVFTRTDEENELLGVEHVCVSTPANPAACSSNDDSCSYYAGAVTCRRLAGESERCEGSIASCTWTRSTQSTECTEVAPGAVAANQSCYDQELNRYWQRFTLDVLDLSTPSKPKLVDPIQLPHTDEAAGLISSDKRLLYAFKRPVTLSNDSRPYVAWYFRPIDFTSPGSPSIGPAVSVPGELLAVDGNELVTRDLVWGEQVAETVVRRLDWAAPDRAELVASHAVKDRAVDSLLLDGNDHVLLTHRAPWSYGYGYATGVGGGVATKAGASSDVTVPAAAEAASTRLRVLDQATLEQLSDVDIDSWATLEQAVPDRALFQVPGGMLVVNLSHPKTPVAQAYFATVGWPSDILFQPDQILLAAGPYGIYRFDPQETNLLQH